MSRLPALLAHAVLGIEAAYERERAGHDGVTLLRWADFLRVLPDDGIALTDLPAAARVSRRAVQSFLRREMAGWSTVTAGVLVPTQEGLDLRAVGAARLAAAETAWAASVGDTGPLRASLEALVGRLDLELPHHPIPYGPADGSMIGGFAVEARPGPPRVPAHGSDWKPVVRPTDVDTVGGLPLHALLSQALVAFTIEFEEATWFPMSRCSMLASSMPTGSAPMATLPRFLGVDGSGKSGPERHGIVRVRDGVASLTSVGRQLRDAYEPRLDAVRAAWSARHGAVVDDLESALAAVDDPAQPDHVLIGFKAGVGFHDVSHTDR